MQDMNTVVIYTIVSLFCKLGYFPILIFGVALNHTYIYTHTYIYIYIYIYTHTKKACVNMFNFPTQKGISKYAS